MGQIENVKWIDGKAYIKCVSANSNCNDLGKSGNCHCDMVKVALGFYDSTVTPVFDGSTIMCSGCGNEIGKIFGFGEGTPTADTYYGPRCPGCGKLIDKEVK